MLRHARHEHVFPRVSGGVSRCGAGRGGASAIANTYVRIDELLAAGGDLLDLGAEGGQLGDRLLVLAATVGRGRGVDGLVGGGEGGRLLVQGRQHVGSGGQERLQALRVLQCLCACTLGPVGSSAAALRSFKARVHPDRLALVGRGAQVGEALVDLVTALGDRCTVGVAAVDQLGDRCRNAKNVHAKS